MKDLQVNYKYPHTEKPQRDVFTSTKTEWVNILYEAKYNPLAGKTCCGTFNLEIAGGTFKFFYGRH